MAVREMCASNMLPSMTATLADWTETLQSGPTMAHFRDWIERNCVSPIIVLDFQHLCDWPWGDDAYIDIKCAMPPSRGCRLYELQSIVRDLQASLEMEIASFRKMCESVYAAIGPINNVHRRILVNRFLTALQTNLAGCARYVHQSTLTSMNDEKDDSNDHTFNKIFCGMWHMPESMKTIYDQLESSTILRFGDDGTAYESACHTFNDTLHLAIMLAFLGNGHYSIASRWRYRALYLNVINKCICWAGDPEHASVPKHGAALMVANNQINPSMRKLILEKTCPGMTGEEREMHLANMNKLQSLNELVILHTAVKSLAAQLTLSDRTKLVQSMYLSFQKTVE